MSKIYYTKVDNSGVCIYCDNKAKEHTDQDGYDVSYSYSCTCKNAKEVCTISNEVQTLQHEALNAARLINKYDKRIHPNVKANMLADEVWSVITSFNYKYDIDANILTNTFAILMSKFVTLNTRQRDLEEK